MMETVMTLKKVKETGRDRLIASSLKLFSQKGFHACSIREICDDAKANVSLVSFHFGGKEGLLDVIFEEMDEDDFDVILSYLVTPKSSEDFKVRLKLFLDSYVGFYLEHPDVVSLYLEELERGHHQAMDRFSTTFGKIWKALVVFLREAQEEKLINVEMDSKMLAYQLISPVTHLMRSRKSAYVNSLFTLDDEAFRTKFLKQIVDSIPS